MDRQGAGSVTVVPSRCEPVGAMLDGDAAILEIVRRRQSGAFFVVDDAGNVLLADRASHTIIPHVAAAVRKLAASADATESQVVAVRRLHLRYLVRLVSLGGKMGRRHGVFVERLRARTAKR